MAGETEEQRLKNDALARDKMATHMQAVEEAEARGETGDRGAWKWKIRKRIWDYLEENDIAENPRPVHHRIPNFKGAELTARQVEALPEFRTARWIKVNPDSPQREVRALVLRHGKMLLMPQPRLRTGFFNVMNPAHIEPQKIQFSVTQAGRELYGEPIDLKAKIKVDMVIIGSVAVNPENGARLGKGEGFAELEYGMLRWMGAIDDDTPVVTCIHDCQLVDDIPSEKMLCHDVPVDIICTPTRTIRVNRNNQMPKPQGIYWDKLSPQKLAEIRILRTLKAMIEAETGEALPCGPEEVLPPTAERTGKAAGKGSAKGGRKGSGKGGGRTTAYGAAGAAKDAGADWWGGGWTDSSWASWGGQDHRSGGGRWRPREETAQEQASSGKGASGGGRRRWRPAAQ